MGLQFHGKFTWQFPVNKLVLEVRGKEKRKKIYRVRLNSSRVKKADALQKHQVFS